MLCKNPIKKTFFLLFFLLVIVTAMLTPAVGYSSPGIPNVGKPKWKVSFDNTPETTSAVDSMASKPALAKITLNKNVTGYVDAYLKKEEIFLQKIKAKSKSFFRVFDRIFEDHDIPVQLKYLAIVESELQTSARSKVGARGLWQLMPVTARELGLKISGKTDERIHTYRSTAAAAKYLRYLYTEFGDWLLVLAAYNSGPGTVLKAIKKAGSRNFWVLQRFLPAESRGHVKRFIGIHYFFEGEGSIATQTKAEAKAWQEKNCVEVASL